MGYIENISEILQETSEEYREIQDILNSHRHEPYPSDHIGDYSRYPKEYRWKDGNGNGWIDARRLKRAISQIEPRAKKIPLDDFKEMARYPLGMRCDNAYRREWKEQKQLEDIDNIKTQNPAVAKTNALIAKRILPYAIGRIREDKEFWLLDLGIGELGTTRGIIAGIPYEKRKLLQVTGVDVHKDARKTSEEMLTSRNPEYGGLDRKNVKMIDCMFGQLDRNEKMKEYYGRFNGIVSFAALHHTDDIVPLFETAYRLLASEGRLEIGDWLHWLWIAEIVRAGANGNIPKQYTEGLKQMAKVWVGLHGYGDEHKQKLEQDFDSSIHKKGFNFHKWMHYNLDGLEPEKEKRTAYQSAEGHRAPHIYAEAIDKVFGNVQHYPIKNLIDSDIPEAILLHGFSARRK